MPDRFARLSRTIAHALRHRPEQYGLELDEDGWTPVELLMAALAREAHWAGLSVDDIRTMMAAAGKQRYELHDGCIRAIYGHSLSSRIAHAPVMPPELLYHGTALGALAKIRREGLKPMRRQYVHLSVDTATAATVARRRTAAPVIITVHAAQAHAEGIVFHRGNSQVWLAGEIGPAYLAFPAGIRAITDIS